MNVSVFSLLMSVLWSSLIILVAHLLRRKAFFLRRVGAPVLVVFYLLSVGRMVLLVEFPFSREVPLRSWFSTAVQAVCIEEHQLGDFGWTWAQAACVCWAAVGIILLLWFSFRYWRAVRRMTQSLARDPLAEEVLQSIRKESKRNLKVQVFRTEQASTPMGVGIFRRKIILPCGEIPAQELEYILRHEYTHFLHGDLWVKLLTQVYCCLFWWNPLVYLLRRDLPQILEIRCDMAVTKDYTVSQKAEYLQTIVNYLKRMGKDVFFLRRVLAPGGKVDEGKLCEAFPKGMEELLAVVSFSDYGRFLEPSFDSLRTGGTLTAFERLCDNYLVSLLAGTRMISFGLEPVVAYLLGRENEIKAVRIVMASKLAGVSPQQITERLRDSYA